MTSDADRVDVILCDAVEIESPADRDRFLDEKCVGNDRLRNKVDELIRNHFSAGSFLHSPVQPIAVTVPHRVAEKPGSVIGPYKLLQQIGEGGFGVVYMAEQAHPVRRKVALKIIKPGMDTKEVIARFAAERQALALMDHPNIAMVLDAGATESGRPYFVMELVKGVPLTEYCDKNHVAARDRLNLFVDVCHAIQHAHQKGVIHRDLKPSNIMITLHDGKPVPKVIDFGVSKALSQQLTEKTLFTAYGQMVGTPAYMSPEQAEMSGLDIDTRSDVYSLGVLLYELLTGCTPFDAKRLRSAGFAEMQRIIREEDPPKPSTRLTTLGEDSSVVSGNRGTDPKKLGHIVRGDLDWIVMKALEKDRDRRYDTADSFSRDIERFLNDEPVEAHPPSAAYKFVKFARRKRRTLVTAATLASVLVLGTAVSTWQAISATQSERMAQTEAATSRAVVEFINRDLLAPSSPFGEPDRNLTVRQALDRASERIDGQFEEQPLVEAAIRHTVGTSYLTLGEFDRAERHLQQAAELRGRLLGREHGKTLASRFNLSTSIFEQGRYLEAERGFEEIMEIQIRVLGAEHSQTLAGMTNRAAAVFALGRYEEADDYTRELLQIQRRVLHEEHPALLKTMANLAAIMKARGEFADAEEHCRDVLQVQRRVLRDEHPDTLDSMTILANAVLCQGRYAEAGSLHNKVLEIRRRVLGPEHPSTLASMNDLSLAIGEQGRYAEAEELRREVLATRRRTLGPEHPSTLQSMMNLANVITALDGAEEAESLLQSVYDIHCRSLGLDHPDTLKSAFNLANAIMAQGRHVEAEECFREVMRGHQRTLGMEHPDTLRIKMNLAVAMHKQGRFVDAELLRREVLETQREILGPEHPDTLATLLNLANAVAAQGRCVEAEESYREVLEKFRSTLGPEHPSTLRSMMALARIIDIQERSTDAEEYYRQVLALQRRALGAEHSDTLNSMNALAWFLSFSSPMEQRNPMEAVSLATEALSHQPDNFRFLRTLSQAQYRAGNWGEAIDVLNESLKVRGPNQHDVLTLALIYWRMGRRDDAWMLYEATFVQESHGDCLHQLHSEFADLTATGDAVSRSDNALE